MIGQDTVNPGSATPASISRAIGVFKSIEETENAVRALKNAGYDMNKVSLIARNVKEIEEIEEITDKRGNESREGAGAGAAAGAVLGGIGGLLVGIGALAIPGVGPAVAVGEFYALATTIAGAGIGAASGSFVGALVGLGIPEEKAKKYRDRIEAGDYLLMVNGSEREVRRAESILRGRDVEDLNVFNASDSPERTTDFNPVSQRESGAAKGEPDVIVVDMREKF